MNPPQTVENIPPGGIIKNKRIFKLKHFDKWLKKHSIPEKSLMIAASEIENGLFEAALGGLLYKKRIPIPGKGKSGGARTIVAYKAKGATIFLFGFAKNQKDNITTKEQIALEKLADLYMNLSESHMKKAIEIGELMEVIENA